MVHPDAACLPGRNAEQGGIVNGIRRVFMVIACSAFLFACGGSSDNRAVAPPDADLVWDEGNWDERDWQ